MRVGYVGDKVNILVLIEKDTQRSVKQCFERCDNGFRVELASNMGEIRRLILLKQYDCIVSTTESSSVGDLIGLQLTLDSPIPVVLFSQNELETLYNLEGYEKMAGRIRRKVNGRRARESGQSNGNVMPTVVVIEDEIYVKGEDGKNVLWGHEGPDIYDVAKTMEFELRAIDYVRDRLAEAVADITEELYLSDLTPENVSDLVYEGYMKLLLWFRDLDTSLGHRRGN